MIVNFHSFKTTAFAKIPPGNLTMKDFVKHLLSFLHCRMHLWWRLVLPADGKLKLSLSRWCAVTLQRDHNFHTNSISLFFSGCGKFLKKILHTFMTMGCI